MQEKKTQKGNPYAIVKFSDLNSIFELFIFSDIFEMNRNLLQEGKSLMLILIKNISESENRFKKINVKKITSMDEVVNKPIKEITFKIDNFSKLDYLKKILSQHGNTEVFINIKDKDKELILKLQQNRNIDRKTINALKNNEISVLIG